MAKDEELKKGLASAGGQGGPKKKGAYPNSPAQPKKTAIELRLEEDEEEEEEEEEDEELPLRIFKGMSLKKMLDLAEKLTHKQRVGLLTKFLKLPDHTIEQTLDQGMKEMLKLEPKDQQRAITMGLETRLGLDAQLKEKLDASFMKVFDLQSDEAKTTIADAMQQNSKFKTLPEEMQKRIAACASPELETASPQSSEDNVEEEKQEQLIDTTQANAVADDTATASPSAQTPENNIEGERQEQPVDTTQSNAVVDDTATASSSPQTPENNITEERQEQPIDTTQANAVVDNVATASPPPQVPENNIEEEKQKRSTETTQSNAVVDNFATTPSPSQPPENNVAEERQEQPINTTQPNAVVFDSIATPPPPQPTENAAEQDNTATNQEGITATLSGIASTIVNTIKSMLPAQANGIPVDSAGQSVSTNEGFAAVVAEAQPSTPSPSPS